MRCVEADFEALRILHRGDERGDLLEACSQAGALASRGFQSDANLQFRMFRMQPVEIANHAGNARLHTRSQMGARVKDQ